MYGDGTGLNGTVGFETVAVGGLKVQWQEIGVAEKAYWNGDSVSSGLLGLAYPAITSVFKGTDPNNDTKKTQEPYNPFFYTALAENKVTEPRKRPFLILWT